MGNSPIVVGIFREEAQVENALDILRNAGFGYDQMGYVLPSGHGVMHEWSKILENMGIPGEETSYYVSELNAGRGIVFVRHDGRLSEALNILILNGTRIHRYLHSGNAGSKVEKISQDAHNALKHELIDHQVAFQDPSSSKQQEGSVALGSGETTDDELATLHRLLKNAGLEHLL